jgi:hypothetical protein
LVYRRRVKTVKFKEFLKKNTKVFLIWTIVGWVVQGLAMIVLQPWGEGLGVAESPARNVWLAVFTWWVPRLPLALLGASIVAKHEKWLAPRGRYVEGQEYPIFSTYTYAAIGFMTALFVATGAVSWQVFDLAAAAAAIATIYFNPIVGWFAVWLGGSLRTVLFAAGGNPLTWFTAIGLYDGTTWLWIGIAYWWLRDKWRDKNILQPIVVWTVGYVLWRGIYELDYLVWLYPMPGLWATILWWWGQFLPTSTISALAGLIASEALIRTIGRRGEAAS